jgi:DNA-directed RNA polymerase specialized sigma24 family protein
MTTGITSIFEQNAKEMPLTYLKGRDTFDERFSRCDKALHLIARRLLADPEMAATAVQNCRLKAYQQSSGFESKGAFGSWILRLLIDEALSVLYRNKIEAAAKPEVSQLSQRK